MLNPSSPLTEPSNHERSLRAAGTILIVIAVVETLFMAMHPTSLAHDVASFTIESARGIPGNAIVHGVLIVVSLLMITGYLGLVDVLGSRRVLVRAGLVAFIAGSACGAMAGLINGFVLPATAASFADAEPAALNALAPVLRLCRVTSSLFAQADVLCLSAAAIAWSACLVRIRGWARVTGVVGLLCGALPLTLIFLGRLPMNVHGFGAFVLLQAVWAICVGVLLVRATRGAGVISR